MSSQQSNQQLQAAAKPDLSKPVRNRATLEGILGRERYLDAVQAMLPKHMDAEKLQKQVFIAANKNPDIYNCTAFSIMHALITAAELGLDCSGTNGEGYLVPFGQTCQFMPGYRGLAKLYRNATGGNVEARVVYDGDEFEYEFGLDKKCRHIPKVDRDANAKPTHFYAIVRDPNFEPEFDVMTKTDVDAIRSRSRAANKGPWVTDYAEMGRKTITRRVLKYQASSPELQKALEADDAQYPQLSNGNGAEQVAGIAGLKGRLQQLTDDRPDVEFADAVMLEPPAEDIVEEIPDTNFDQTEAPEAGEAETPEQTVDPKESKRLDLIASIDELFVEVFGSDAKAIAEFLDGRELTGMELRDLKNLYVELNRRKDKK